MTVMITYCGQRDRGNIRTVRTYTVPDDREADLKAALERSLPMTGHYWREDDLDRSKTATENGEQLLAWHARRAALDNAIAQAREAAPSHRPLPDNPDLRVIAEGFEHRMVRCILIDTITRRDVHAWWWEPPETVQTSQECEQAWRDTYGEHVDLMWIGWTPGPPAEMVSAAGAARLLGISRSSLRTYISRGLGPDWVGPGGDRWWRVETLMSWRRRD